MKARLASLTMLGGMFVALTNVVPAFAATTMVNETSPGVWTPTGWTEYNRANGNVSMTSDYPDLEGFGKSSLKVVTTTDPGDSKTTLWNSDFLGQELDFLNTISYYTYRDSNSTQSEKRQVAALNVEIDYNGLATSGGFSTLVFEPVYNTDQGEVVENEWQQWNAGDTATWWSSNPINGMPNRSTYLTLAEIKANNPEAVIGKIGINQGGGNAGLISGADGLVLNNKTYDFESPVTLANKEQCKNGGWRESTNPAFKNQGECVSKFASEGKSQGNQNPVDQVVSFFRSFVQ